MIDYNPSLHKFYFKSFEILNSKHIIGKLKIKNQRYRNTKIKL